jgi:hypothetical protein
MMDTLRSAYRWIAARRKCAATTSCAITERSSSLKN